MTGDARLWWKRGVVYQVYPRSFQDSDGNGVGDLPGVIERLDYLAWLGIEAVWLSPFMKSPQADFGYDVSDYRDVDPLFGTLADLERLIAEAHRRELAVVIDFVPNHTSDQHPWFLESRSSRTNPKRDWYVWRDAKPDGSLPNNWLAAFGGPSWELDPATGQYYLHSFLPQQPDLNWRNPEVKAEMFDVIRFWLDRGVDGFRIDVAHYLMKDPELRDNPPNPRYVAGKIGDAHKAMGAVESQLHVNDRGHPDIHALYREIRGLFDEYSVERPRAMIGETHVWDVHEWARYYGANLDEMHLPFNFGLLKTAWNPAALRAHVEGIEAAVPAGGWPNYVLGNHDESRVATRIGREAAPAAMMLLLTLRGTPTIYYGDELGMEDVSIPPEKARDPWGLRVPGLHLGRDPQRTPMQWDDTPNAGFCPPGVDPWLPVGSDATTVNVQGERGDPRSMLVLTRELLAVRRGYPALSLGTYKPAGQEPAGCFAFLREGGGKRFLVAINTTGGSVRADFGGMGRGEVVLSTRLDRYGAERMDAFALREHEGVIVELRSRSSS